MEFSFNPFLILSWQNGLLKLLVAIHWTMGSPSDSSHVYWVLSSMKSVPNLSKVSWRSLYGFSSSMLHRDSNNIWWATCSCSGIGLTDLSKVNDYLLYQTVFKNLTKQSHTFCKAYISFLMGLVHPVLKYDYIPQQPHWVQLQRSPFAFVT